MKKSFGRGNGDGAGGFRQPRFEDQYRRNSVGRGSHTAAPSWQSRDSYLRDQERNGGFGTFHQNHQREQPSMTAPVTAEEMNSPARETNRDKRWNMYENGHNRSVSRHEIEQWINAHCEQSFYSNRTKMDTMVEFFMSSKSAQSTFRYLVKVRGPKYVDTFF